MVNTEKGLLEVQRMACAGMKLSCQLKVQSSVWIATEVTTSLRGPCQGRLWKGDTSQGDRICKNAKFSGQPDYQVTPAFPLRNT